MRPDDDEVVRAQVSRGLRDPAARPLVRPWAALVVVVLTVGAVLALTVLGGGSDVTVRAPQPGSASWWAVLAVLVVQGALLAVGGRPAREVVVAVALAVPVAAACGLAELTGFASIAVVVAVYVAVARAPSTRVVAPLVVAGVLVAVGHVLAARGGTDAVASTVGSALLQPVGAVVAPAAVAVFLTARRDARRAREEQLLAVAREREARLEATVSHERMAMARELHDIAAHHLSGIAVMTAAIGAQIDTDPEGAKQSAALVREQSRSLLRDLRRLVGLLRDDTPGAVGSRQPSLAEIGALVEQATAAGARVDHAVLAAPGDPVTAHGVGPLAQVAAYRIVQESLANAARHAPGAAVHVVVDDRAPDHVEVTVRNDPATGPAVAEPGGGFGLVGMRERAELTGADLTHGPTPDGGWQVVLRVPRSDAVPDAAEGPA